ncbi:flagellar protein FlaG protein [Pseudobacteroides cellulosolvens ATCC 35603 = DSM 2933]|uniref:Flagellar protein FlaG protein n=2 Tax=Pseudobacteroides cellulosolvens TaxID=35825 RepID=A0A0L6JT66_9FIRM|nr:flagellar protein FlaG [Pseudobacteroides cellulosolvens]KNY28612.1 flagellar protein FlaG protein [Pseudobacteroides cellulosolvens ATCC 35603 = DSM 2933]
MKIDSTDATGKALSLQHDQNLNKTENKQNLDQSQVTSIDLKSYMHMSDYQKSELPISEKVVIDAIEKANKAISGTNRSFEFSIHEKTKAIMVKVVDNDTHEVIREIPAEKILDMVAKMWEMAGIMVDERR